MKDIKNIPGYFLLIILAVSLYFGYIIFRPYLSVIIMAAIFALLFFPIYKWIRSKTKGRDGIAAFLTVMIFVLIILIPLGNFVALLVKESIETYPILEAQFSNGQVNVALDQALSTIQWAQDTYLPFLDENSVNIKSMLLDLGSAFTTFIIRNANVLVVGTTNFFVSLFFMLITMYYLFKDGEYFVERLMHLTPLSDKYDRKLFDKFRDVSKSTILSSLVTAIIQGILGAIAYFFVGVPVLFLGVATGIASLIPIVGTALVWVPVVIVLAVSGHWFSAGFLLLWGVVIIAMSDNLIRTKMIESKSKIHPLLVFFSIFGGLKLWGVLGIIFGPLVLAILLTVIHIYELEYTNVLEK